jgi:hypothetical protein
MLAGMLARDDPYGNLARRRAADSDKIQITTLHGGTQIADRGVGRHFDTAEQVQVALVGIGLKVREVDAVALGSVFDNELAVLIAGTADAEPVATIIGGTQR